MNDGYIKFTSNWKKQSILIANDELDNLNYYRSKLVQLSMIGKIEGGPGFGNISYKSNKNTFIITGSDTGGFNSLERSHLSLVTNVNIKENNLSCTGLTIASSESMSHAAIYNTLSSVKSIIHIHHKEMWNFYKGKLPTTDSSITYGTPEMAFAINREILSNSNSNTLILGGHEDGIIVFNTSLSKCYSLIANLFDSIK